MDSKRKPMVRRQEIDYSDWEYYVTLSGSLNSSSGSDSYGDDHLNSSNTDNDHEVALTGNPGAGAGAGSGVISSPEATATSDGELESFNNGIRFRNPAFPTCNNSSSLNPTILPYRHFPTVSSTGEGVIEIDLTNDLMDDDRKEMSPSPRRKPPPPPVILKRPRTQPASIIATKPQPATPSSFVAEVETEKYPNVNTATLNEHNCMTSTPAPSGPMYNPVYPGSESWNWNWSVHSMANTGTNFTQYQNPNPNVNSFHNLWGDNMEWRGPVNFPPPSNPHLPPLNYYSNSQRSRYSVPWKPTALITINTDTSNNAETRTPSAPAASVLVPVVTPNPKSASVHVNNAQKEIQEKTADAATLSGVEVKDQDGNQNRPDSVCTVVRVASSSSSGQSMAVPGPAPVPVPEALLNTSISDLISSSTTSITEEPCTDVKKELVKSEPLDFSLIVTSPYVKYGFHRLYDISTDAKGNSEEFLCIVGGCTITSKTYEGIEKHINEKHLKSGEPAERSVLFTRDPDEGEKKAKFTCNFLGCEKQANTPSQKSHHVSFKHLDKRNYCPILHCHEKFFYEKQMYYHLGTFHRTEDNGGKKPKPGNGP